MTSSVARALAGLGAAVALVGTFLHFSSDLSIWQNLTRADVFLAAVCVASMLLAAAAWARPSAQLDRMLIASAGAGFGIEAFLAVERYYSTRQAGFFFIAAAAVIQGVGLIMFFLPAPRPRAVEVSPPAGGVRPAEEGRAAAPPPAGWYPDPAGSADERYWDGTAWTDRTQPPAR